MDGPFITGISAIDKFIPERGKYVLFHLAFAQFSTGIYNALLQNS